MNQNPGPKAKSEKIKPSFGVFQQTASFLSSAPTRNPRQTNHLEKIRREENGIPYRTVGVGLSWGHEYSCLQGEYLSPRERAVDAVRLFSKEGKLLTSISGKVFAASLTDIAEYLTQKTSAVAGAPPTFSNEIVKTKGIGPLFAGLFGGYILFLTVTALVIYYA
ncbi:hypothetical protein GT370_17475 [Acidocella sp. MX-AZ03]|uniref:hypothetical protein n=1 Tax=Acidocella sp. MX-AZ03 TaxID=2697363 RepID=UPI0022DDB25F|nr:hypothetical protein [Acidocella sp. MX-AZ03]WBO58873.1 hypothetical protein GT370_17475 [Acidocella sp. MX-AZ03]